MKEMVFILFTCLLVVVGVVIILIIRKYRLKKQKLISSSLMEIESFITEGSVEAAQEKLTNISNQIPTRELELKEKAAELSKKIFEIKQKIAAQQLHDELQKSLSKLAALLDSYDLKTAQTALNSLVCRIPIQEMDLLTKANELKCKLQEKEQAQIAESIELAAKAYNEIKKGNIEQAISSVDNAQRMLPTNAPASSKQTISEYVNKIKVEYKNGIIPQQVINHTNYSVDFSIPNKDGFYCSTLFPKYNTVLYPYRQKKVEQRGYTEEAFQSQLSRALQNVTNIKVLGDVSILAQSGTHPYEPDIALVEQIYNKGLRIDIEIDEPYVGGLNKPIHHIGCGDNYRDQVLANLGWIVVRFSEKQIFCEAEKCVAYIQYIIASIEGSSKQVPYIYPDYDKKWTMVEANLRCVNKYREKLLNHTFPKIEDAIQKVLDIKQTDLEIVASKEVAPISFQRKQYINLDKSDYRSQQDECISFDPFEHIYLYNGTKELSAVSNVINQFFEPFDVLSISQYVARRDGVLQEYIIEKWDQEGAKSRDVGAFMHAQIERVINNERPQTSMTFDYQGAYVNTHEEISIVPEIQYFQKFLADAQIVPFRTEWHIYDLECGIAGTIDLLCKNKGVYEIYDWKRSRKALPTEPVYRYSINGLDSIPDISFYHYALQQNLYKYMLEKNYGISVSNMYIVIFHSCYLEYKLLKLPEMNEAIKIIESYLKNQR